jgi:hypothetical protein
VQKKFMKKFQEGEPVLCVLFAVYAKNCMKKFQENEPVLCVLFAVYAKKLYEEISRR